MYRMSSSTLASSACGSITRTPSAQSTVSHSNPEPPFQLMSKRFAGNPGVYIAATGR